MSARLHHIIRTFCILGAFVFAVLGVRDMFMTPDIVFDRFVSVVFFIGVFLWYRRLNQNVLTLIPAVFGIVLHGMKLYGNVYFGLEFDMIMHFTAGFAMSVIIFQYLRGCEGVGCLSPWKLAFLAVFVSAGLGTILEITEYFGYAHLAPGEGILHFGEGDAGEWRDAIWDMISNILGAVFAVLIGIISTRKRVPLGLMRYFIRRHKKRKGN